MTGSVTFDGAATWLKEGGEVQVEAYTIPNVPGIPTNPTPADSLEHINTERTPNACSLNQTDCESLGKTYTLYGVIFDFLAYYDNLTNGSYYKTTFLRP